MHTLYVSRCAIGHVVTPNALEVATSLHRRVHDCTGQSLINSSPTSRGRCRHPDANVDRLPVPSLPHRSVPRPHPSPCAPPACVRQHTQINYNNKDHLVGAMLVAGWDKHGGGQVYGCPIGGTLVKDKWAIDGSGSTYIWAYCDSEFRCGRAGRRRVGQGWHGHVASGQGSTDTGRAWYRY